METYDPYDLCIWDFLSQSQNGVINSELIAIYL